jgi:hypothetical protein
MIGLALGLGACATIVEGTDQTISISTAPTGASCTMVRAGQTIGLITATPGIANIEKSKNDIVVTCSKDEHVDTVRVLSSETQGMTFGNFLLGGGIGFAIDAGSGAMHEYPPVVAMNLPPVEFATLAARDKFYDLERARIELEASQALTHVKDKCDRREPEVCDQAEKEIEKELAVQLAKNEQNREQSRISES